MVDDRSAAGSADYEQLHEVYGVHIRLAQYPILAPRIREPEVARVVREGYHHCAGVRGRGPAEGRSPSTVKVWPTPWPGIRTHLERAPGC